MGAMWFCPVLLFASIISVLVLAIGRKIDRENDVPIFCLMILIDIIFYYFIHSTMPSNNTYYSNSFHYC